MLRTCDSSLHIYSDDSVNSLKALDQQSLGSFSITECALKAPGNISQNNRVLSTFGMIMLWYSLGSGCVVGHLTLFTAKDFRQSLPRKCVYGTRPVSAHPLGAISVS